ncbi:MAG TPA: ankyrin repeat domain-containing protein [Stellaceae bacterium]
MTRRWLLQCLGTVLLLAGSAARAFAVDFPEWYTLANAASQNKTEDVLMMLRRGDNPNFTDDSGRTPLDYAASFGNTTMLAALLDNRARVDYRDKFGRIALHWAAELGQGESIRVLLAAKSPVDATAPQGITALMLAASANKAAAVKLLLAAGADPKKQDFTGRDALGWAAGKPAAQRILEANRG